MRLIFVLSCLLFSANSMGSDESQAAIATAHPLATQAGFEILECI